MTGYDIVKCMDAAFSRGDFRAVDWFVSGLDPQDMTPNQIISVLTICWHARDQLTELVPFYTRAEKELTEALGAQRAIGLLKTRNPCPICTGRDPALFRYIACGGCGRFR